MALIFCDDGEGGTSAYAWTETTSTGHSTNAKDGTYAINQTDGAFYNKKVLGSTYTELFFSIYFLFRSSISHRLLSWYSAGTTELGSVRWNATSKLFEIYTGTTLQATGTAVQQATPQGGSWFNLNIRVLLHGSTGEIAVRHEGSTSADVVFTGNTLPSGSNMNAFQVFSTTSHSSEADDFWCNDTSGSVNNSWPGVKRSFTQFPTGKSATNDAFTADSGSNKYDRINEQPTNAASFIYSESTGQKQGLTYAAPSSLTGVSVSALVINDVSEKISSGGLKQGVRMGGTDYPSSTKSLKTSITRESQLQHYLEVRPTDSAAWDTSTDNPESYLEKTA